MNKPITLIGLLGTTLDGAKGKKRWERWRPTVSLFQHEDLLIDRLELLHEERFESLGEIVEDDVLAVSPDTKVKRHHVSFGDAWDFESVYATLHDFARGYVFRDDREYLVHITTGTHVAQICSFILTESRHFPARLIQSSPPRPRSAGGPGSFEIIDLDLSRYDRIAQRFRQETDEHLSFLKAGIETQNDAFNKLMEQIEHVATASVDPMLLMGPTGAGKSQLARRIFQLKKQRQKVSGDLVEVNCATLRGDHAMSALFGHTKGAFTGAQKERPGLLRAANKGLLFLDEIGELGLDEQAMLLRAIEQKVFLPVGADREVESDFQLIAGTNRDLRAAVTKGEFREDLLARIDLWSFTLPGLRDRREDIPPNLAFELDRCGARMNTNVTFNAEARKRFLDFAMSESASWRGNFRDFGAAITRMATLAPGGRIDVATVDDEIARLQESWGGAASSGGDDHEALHEVLGDAADALDLFDRVQLAEVIRVCRASKTLSAAGRALFAESRKKRKTANDADRLRKYLGKWSLTFDQVTAR